MLKARLVAAIGKEAIHVLGHWIVVVAVTDTVKVSDGSGKLLVNGQRKAPKLWRQWLLSG